MIQKSYTLKDFLGLNNVARHEHLQPQELTAAYNLDLTDANTLRRRNGRRSVYQGACHSLFSDGTYLYFRTGTTMLRYDAATETTSTIKTGIVGDNRMNYLKVMDRVYYTDGIITGCIDQGVDRTWGIVAPLSPTISETVGDLQSGTYSLAITYMRLDGQESGASKSQLIRITTGGIALSAIPQSSDTGVAYIVVYMTPCNAETLYRFSVLPHGTTTMTFRGGNLGAGMPLQTANSDAPPSGQLLDNYNGRIYVAAGDVLWYTNPHQYEHVDYRFNFMQFNGRITMLQAVDGGLWISSGGMAHFLAGDDPLSESAPMNIKISLGYPAIEGTSATIDGSVIGRENNINGTVAVWASKNGICVGTPDGILIPATEKRFKPSDVSMGVATTIRSGDSNQYVFAVNTGLDGGTARFPQFRN